LVPTEKNDTKFVTHLLLKYYCNPSACDKKGDGEQPVENNCLGENVLNRDTQKTKVFKGAAKFESRETLFYSEKSCPRNPILQSSPYHLQNKQTNKYIAHIIKSQLANLLVQTTCSVL
jgi:hypothetical protein